MAELEQADRVQSNGNLESKVVDDS